MMKYHRFDEPFTHSAAPTQMYVGKWDKLFGETGPSIQGKVIQPLNWLTRVVLYVRLKLVRVPYTSAPS